MKSDIQFYWVKSKFCISITFTAFQPIKKVFVRVIIKIVSNFNSCLLHATMFVTNVMNYMNEIRFIFFVMSFINFSLPPPLKKK